ncbi:hypothetical protein [Piscinibacter terrae]|uniref:Uncharacterized protein n=1 Tax=Piscinibacter terrae TaxID=2496871 RepID=A0A3N7HUW0_9BURK|nr:hypothetical protein [Albitalea terrae]RQP26127.1 hypothetical protein DZC73_03535 [Albitalea terrae]
MTFIARLRCAAAQAAAVFLVAGCGGGGGGSDGSLPTAHSVSVTNVQVPAVKHEVFEGYDGIPKFQVVADLTGDLSQLNGKTIFVNVEDPDHLVAQAYVILSGGASGNTLVIEPWNFNATVGHLKGALRIFLCLDAACTTPLGNTPISVPYDITVLPGLKVSAGESIDMQAAFGGTTQTTVGVTLPPGTQSWEAHIWNSQSLGFPTTDAVTLETTNAPSPAVTLKAGLTRVGKFQPFLALTATAVTSTGRQVLLQQTTPINYTITATGSGAVAQPASSTFTMPVSSRVDVATVRVLEASGVHPINLVDHIEYLPPGASGNANAGGFEWLVASSTMDAQDFDTLSLAAHACPLSGTGGCLAPGRYDAIVYMTNVAANGSVTLMPYPVSLTVTP